MEEAIHEFIIRAAYQIKERAKKKMVTTSIQIYVKIKGPIIDKWNKQMHMLWYSSHEQFIWEKRLKKKIYQSK